VLPSLDSQMRARLIAFDRRLNPVNSPNLAANLAGQLSMPSLGAFAPLLGDERNNNIWEQMVDDYARMMADSGDSLIAHSDVEPAQGVAWSCRQLRLLCHKRMLELPRVTVAAYRARIDPEAEALLTKAQQTRSAKPLRRLVDELFCSSFTDQALDLLGDLAFERGDFDEARQWWARLAPLEDARDWPEAPDARVDRVRVRAKQGLALTFQGRLNEARESIARFRKQFPRAGGDLAGRNGIYADILQAALTGLAKERISNNDEPWATFAGAATRNRILTAAPWSHLWEDGPAWRVKLPSLTPPEKDAPIHRGTPARNLAFHPIIVKDQVLIADHRSVVSYHLVTGRELFRFDLKAAGLEDPGLGLDARIGLPRFTLSADETHVYARLGRMAVGPKDASKPDASYIVCLDITQPEIAKKRLVWHAKAAGDDRTVVAFEGTPLVQAGSVYVALSKVANYRTITSIVCYDRHGRERWTREVCDVAEFETPGHDTRYRHHLLTWADGHVVYCSHAGAIVAVDAWTGHPTWGVRYPSRGPLTSELEASPRDLTPCVSAAGLVFAAPLDSDRIFAIDPASGRVAWERDGIEIVQLLGVAHGRVYATTRNGLVVLDAASGHVERTQPSEGRLPGLGRGLIAGAWLFWPTEDPKLPYRAVTLASGKQTRDAESVLPEPAFWEPSMMHALPVGNWAFGEGCLAIAGQGELAVYVPAQRYLGVPDRPKPHARIDELYERARRLASAGDFSGAVGAYRELQDATKTHRNAADWRTLIEGRIRFLEPRRDLAERAAATLTKTAPLPFAADVQILPLVHAWQQDDGRVWQTESKSVIFCTDRGQIACRTLADGALRWRTALSFEPAWLAHRGDAVVVAGPDGVAALRTDDGARVWSFPAPSRYVRPGFVKNGTPVLASGSAGFVLFQTFEDDILVLDDFRHLYRIRLATGEVVWHHAHASADLRPLDGAAFRQYVTSVGSKLFL
jgi:outer membrane protein assembly factor BamB